MAFTLTDDSDYPRLTRGVQWLIAINVAIFFVQLTVVGQRHMLSALGFEASDLSNAWWTIVTYMFVHGGLVHILVNMYTLYVFGPRVEHSWNTTEFIKFYIVAGLGGWLFHLIFVRDGLLHGASAAVFGVTLAYAMQWPDDEVFLFGVLPIKVKWMAALLIGFNLIHGLTPSGQGGGVAYMAHLGGVAAAWLYMRSAGTGASIERFKQRVSAVPDLPDETPRAVPRSLPRSREQQRGAGVDEIVARSNAALSQRQTADPSPAATRTEPSRAGDLDAVLDKISRSGIDSLTSTERRLLEQMSRELRGKE